MWLVHSGGEGEGEGKVKLCTTMVFWHGLLWYSCFQFGLPLGTVTFVYTRYEVEFLGAPPLSQASGGLLWSLVAEMLHWLCQYFPWTLVWNSKTLSFILVYWKVLRMLFKLKLYPTLFPWAVLLLRRSCWNSCLLAFCIAVIWLV